MTHPHPTAAELLAHARRSASPAETLEVSGHLAVCADCRTAFASLIHASAGPPDLAQPGPAPGVDYETLTGYLDGTLDPVDREILEADLRNHPGLALQLAGLRRLRADEELAVVARHARVIPFPSTRRALLWGAAAAALLMVAGLSWRYASAPRAPLTVRDDGRETSVDALAEAADVPPELQAAVRTTIRTGELPFSADLKTLRGQEGILLAEPADPNPEERTFHLSAPVGVAVRGLQPVFRWTPCAGASAYRVTILDMQDGEVRSSPALPATDGNIWTPVPPLAAGRRYAWQVQALDPAGSVLAKTPVPPRPEARFQTLDSAQETGLRRLELTHPQAHLLLAVAAARLGLLPEAEEQLQALAISNPSKPLPAELLRNLKVIQSGVQPSAASTPTATNGAQ